MNDPNALGVTGVSRASDELVCESRSWRVWNASCTSDGSVGLGDFCVFMHLLKHALNGGSMPDFRIEGSFREEMLGADIVNEEASDERRARVKDEESETESQLKSSNSKNNNNNNNNNSTMPPPVNIATPPHAQSQQQQQQQQQQASRRVVRQGHSLTRPRLGRAD